MRKHAAQSQCVGFTCSMDEFVLTRAKILAHRDNMLFSPGFLVSLLFIHCHVARPGQEHPDLTAPGSYSPSEHAFYG